MASKGPEDNEEIPSKTSSDKSGDPAPEQRPERSDYKGDSELWRREAQFTSHRDVCKARASGSRAALAEVVPMKEERTTAPSDGKARVNRVSCDSARKVSSQSLRCAVLFIVKIPQSIREPAALPVQAVCSKVCSTMKEKNFIQKEANVSSAPAL
ncbi:hypothetical protein U0070_008248 [Myodes glareolus]|uniref:Uncharacterized protein n=1 Tax=Myodes glareolus TaxID=447135 RepID=A0AAW0I6K9_MYOGA